MALKRVERFRYIGQSVPRPDVPAKVTGRHLYVQNLTLPGMLHGRAIRPPALGAALQSVDESSIAAIPGARVVRIGGFLGVVAEREWDAVRAARLLKTEWSAGTGLPDYLTLADAVRATKVVRDQDVAKKGDLSALDARPVPASGRSARRTGGRSRRTARSARPVAWRTSGRTARRSGRRPRPRTATARDSPGSSASRGTESG